jgi:LPXTG-motif cell wall-anchored protein
MTTTAGLGNNLVSAVYTDGNNVYAATDGGLSISAACASPPTLAETGVDPSLILVGSGMYALLLFVGAAAILASRRKRASD